MLKCRHVSTHMKSCLLGVFPFPPGAGREAMSAGCASERLASRKAKSLSRSQTSYSSLQRTFLRKGFC